MPCLPHPAAVLAMAAPELAVDPRAPAHHLRSTCELARKRMFATARLALKPQTQGDLFEVPPQERLTA